MPLPEWLPVAGLVAIDGPSRANEFISPRAHIHCQILYNRALKQAEADSIQEQMMRMTDADFEQMQAYHDWLRANAGTLDILADE